MMQYYTLVKSNLKSLVVSKIMQFVFDFSFCDGNSQGCIDLFSWGV